MRSFTDQNVGVKLTLLISVMLLCLITVAGISMQQLSTVNDASNTMYSVNVKALDSSKKARIALISSSRALRNMMIAPTGELREKYRQSFYADIAVTYEELNNVASVIDKPEHRALLRDVRLGLDEHFALEKAFVRKIGKVPSQDLFQELLALRIRLDAVETLMASLAQTMTTEAQARIVETERIYSRGFMFSLSGLLVALTLGGSIGYAITRSIAKPLGQVTEKAVLVAEGNLQQHFKLVRQDEIGQLAAALDQMVANLCQRITETEQKNHELTRTRFLFLKGMASLAETRDPETGDHLVRVSRYIKILAVHLRSEVLYKRFFNAETVAALGRAAILHDIGKVGVPDSILLKPGKLTPEEFGIMAQHTIFGEHIIKRLQRVQQSHAFLQYAADIAGGHHECWDGSGYPRGLKGTEIPLAARLMAIVDVYDSMVSPRVYKESQAHAEAVRFIMEQRGKRFDPVLAEIFCRHQEKFQEVAQRFAPYAKTAPVSEDAVL